MNRNEIVFTTAYNPLQGASALTEQDGEKPPSLTVLIFKFAGILLGIILLLWVINH